MQDIRLKMLLQAASSPCDQALMACQFLFVITSKAVEVEAQLDGDQN